MKLFTKVNYAEGSLPHRKLVRGETVDVNVTHDPYSRVFSYSNGDKVVPLGMTYEVFERVNGYRIEVEFVYAP